MRTRPTPRFRIALLLAVTTSAATCGGKVAVDGAVASTGGTGGGASSSSSGGLTTTVASSSSSAASSGGSALCSEACAVLLAKGCAGPGCEAACNGHLDPASMCNDVTVALLTCIRDQGPTASSCIIDACTPLREKLIGCTTICTAPLVGNDGSGTACVGKAICGLTERASQCTSPGGMCTCLGGTGDVTTCVEEGPFLCDFANGCCAKGGGG
jgi:hypothetical protein